MRREAAADVRLKAQQGAHRGARHVDDLDAVEHAQGGRIGGGARQLLQMVLGDLLDIHRFEIGRPELEHLGPQQEVTPVAGDVAEFLQRQQAAACGGRRDAGAAGNVAEAQGRVVAREGADDGQSLGESSHRLATRRRFSAP